MEARKLLAERDAVEAEIESIRSRLKGEGIGDRTPLIDAEGFPRSDVDVARVRQDRNRLARLYNDYKSLSAQVERAIHAIHAENRTGNETGETRGNGTGREPATPAVDPPPSTPTYTSPFALVDEILANSPTDLAGMKVGDQVLAFGGIEHANFGGNLAQVAEYAQSHKDSTLDLVVIRAGEPAKLKLIPREWDGPGLLGCHMRKVA